MKINFYPDSDLSLMEDAVLEYEHLWASDGERKIKFLENLTSTE